MGSISGVGEPRSYRNVEPESEVPSVPRVRQAHRVRRRVDGHALRVVGDGHERTRHTHVARAPRDGSVTGIERRRLRLRLRPRTPGHAASEDERRDARQCAIAPTVEDPGHQHGQESNRRATTAAAPRAPWTSDWSDIDGPLASATEATPSAGRALTLQLAARIARDVIEEHERGCLARVSLFRSHSASRRRSCLDQRDRPECFAETPRKGSVSAWHIACSVLSWIHEGAP